MKWDKLGLVFSPDNNNEWMRSYASYPLPIHLEGDLYKIYFSTRNQQNKSHIGFVTIDMKNPLEVLDVSSTPCLAPGAQGQFDQDGISISCSMMLSGKRHFYYLGWKVMEEVPWQNTIGVAIENEEGFTFSRLSDNSIVGINEVDPHTLTYPFILFDEGIYKMWYGSSLFWGKEIEDTEHVIKYATSEDGIHWKRDNVVCISPQNDGEFAIVKPFVIKENNMYRMWYSYRLRENYYIGYAESTDGLGWTRMDDLSGIEASDSGWDGEMVCYPFIFEHDGKRYMLYNGNAYGKTGFGIAVLNE